MSHKTRVCPVCNSVADGRIFRRYTQYRCLCGWVCEELRATDECLATATQSSPPPLWSYYLSFASLVQARDLNLHAPEASRLMYVRRCVKAGLFTEGEDVQHAVNVS